MPETRQKSLKMSSQNQGAQKATKAVYERLAEKVNVILWEDWDPIGVNDISEARDEYSSYVPLLVRLLQEGADAISIAKHLETIEKLSMGVESWPDRRKCAAEKIVALRSADHPNG